MVDEKYISPEEAKRAQAEPLRLNLRRDPPSIAPYFLEEVRKYLEKEYGSQRIYQGGLRVYTTLDSATQIAASTAARDWLRRLDRRSRGFVPPTESVLKDGHFPDRIHLEDWEQTFAVGDVVRGVVLASERGLAVVRLGDYEAKVGPAEMAWTRRSNVAEVLRPGTVAPFRIDALPGSGSAKDMKVSLEQEPEVQGALLALEPRTGAVRAMVGGYDFQRSKFNRATQAMTAGGLRLQALRLRRRHREGGLHARHPHRRRARSPTPTTPAVWTPHNFDYKFEGPIPMRRALEDSRNVPAVKTLELVGRADGHRLRAQARPERRAASLPAPRARARARRRSSR